MKDKSTVICVVNQKGGTAKTTTVENLGIGLAREGKKVLLVDTDPQGSLTISLGYPRPDDLETTLFDLLNKTINEDAIHPAEGILHQAEGVDLIPANISLAGLEVALGKGAGYTAWAKKFNLKQTGKTLLFLQEHNIHSYADLEKAVQSVTDGADHMLTSIKEKDARIKEIDAMKQHIFNYSKTHQTYLEYKRLPKGNKAAFYEAHRAELELHEAAKKAFDALPEGTKLPTIKALNAKRKELTEERRKEYEQYRTLRDQKKEFQKAKQNADVILGRTQEDRDERPREK